MIPKKIFLIPFRNRYNHKQFFDIYMKYLLEDLDDYRIFFIHQNDNRVFNRGAIKNIGFLVIKKLYPNDYHKITLVFNDIDTLPFKKNFLNYNTVPGIIKHFYGFDFALGGIVSINAKDFENIGGFLNFWGWGMEDNYLNHIALNNNLKIDRSNFAKINNNNNRFSEFIHLYDDNYKTVSEENKWRYKYYKNNPTYSDNLFCIKDLNYTIENEFINVNKFNCKINCQDNSFFNTNQTSKIIYNKNYIPKELKKNNFRLSKINFL